MQEDDDKPGHCLHVVMIIKREGHFPAYLAKPAILPWVRVASFFQGGEREIFSTTLVLAGCNFIIITTG